MEMPEDQIDQKVDEVLGLFNLEDRKEEPLMLSSLDTKRFVTIACLLALDPKILILDEPTNDVDPLRRRILWRQVREISEMGSAVLLVTHNVLEAERAVGRLAIIDQGKVIGMGTPASLKETDGESMRLELILEPRVDAPVPPDFLQHTFVTGRRLVARLEDSNVAPALEWARNLKEMDIVEEFSLGPTTLEDVYVKMVGRPDALEMFDEEVNNAPNAS